MASITEFGTYNTTTPADVNTFTDTGIKGGDLENLFIQGGFTTRTNSPDEVWSIVDYEALKDGAVSVGSIDLRLDTDETIMIQSTSPADATSFTLDFAQMHGLENQYPEYLIHSWYFFVALITFWIFFTMLRDFFSVRGTTKV